VVDGRIGKVEKQQSRHGEDLASGLGRLGVTERGKKREISKH